MMKKILTGAWVLAMAWPAHAQAQGGAVPTTKFDAGRSEFETHCASCHGLDGKGRGPIVDLLRKAPPDLTVLARKNGGILPMARLYDSVTGDLVPAHGSRDMPIWGAIYRTDAANYYVDVPYNVDAYVRGRVLFLLEYIHRLQVK